MPLEDDPFDWRTTKDGQVLVSRGGRLVTTVRGRSAAALLARLEPADETAVQHLLARATGNYKRGNERG
jgi:phytoene dehydrogenase-like protein